MYLHTSPHSSFFFILTGAHAVHVAAGVVLLVYTAMRIGTVTRMAHSGPRVDCAAPVRLVTAAATFWHFLGALWLYVFALITVF